MRKEDTEEEDEGQQEEQEEQQRQEQEENKSCSVLHLHLAFTAPKSFINERHRLSSKIRAAILATCSSRSSTSRNIITQPKPNMMAVIFPSNIWLSFFPHYCDTDSHGLFVSAHVMGCGL